MKKIIRRVLILIPAVLLQLLWIFLLVRWLAPWAGPISMALSIVALLAVLFIITKRDEGGYKILWLLVILSFPVGGILLYLMVGNRRSTKPLQKRLSAAQPYPGGTDDTEALCQSLAQQAPRMAETFRYIYSFTGCPLYLNREARYYPLGDLMFPVMLEEVKKAKRYIFAEYFIVEPGVMLDSLVDVMAEKVAQGVDVRMMYDDLGSFSTYSDQNVKELRAKGIQCIPFNPLRSIRGTINYRNHRKMLIIDGAVAFSGGINLADEYINKVERFGHWKDGGFRITGEAVEGYTRMFTEFWNAFSGAPIPPELFSAPPAPAEEKPADGYILSYYDSPLRPIAASNELYIELLSQAKDYAWFFTPYLLLGDALMDALCRAARRGVDVRIIMPGIPDKPLVFRMSHSFYPVLLDAGVKIYEYIPGFVHSKGCVVDGVVGTVGTVNLDYRSLFLHFENNSLFYGASLLKDVKADFLATQEQCRQMELGKNVKSGFWRWTLDGILRIFAPLC